MHPGRDVRLLTGRDWERVGGGRAFLWGQKASGHIQVQRPQGSERHLAERQKAKGGGIGLLLVLFLYFSTLR